MKVKIYGAGSIGNHMANASRFLNWEVEIVDIDENALSRTQYKIYPERYGSWDSKISLKTGLDSQMKNYDLAIIGCPPHVHNEVLKAVIKENPRAILTEKPICPPIKETIEEFKEIIKNFKGKHFVGYNHQVSKSAMKLKEIIEEQKFDGNYSITVNWQESFSGILKAHPWLSGIQDSYLGSWKKGGGALGEHSHGVAFWCFLNNLISGDEIKKLRSEIVYKKDKSINYDNISKIFLETNQGNTGLIIQDMCSDPSIKKAYIKFSNWSLEWFCNKKLNFDYILYKGLKEEEFWIEKTRAKEFIWELEFIEKAINENNEYNNIIDISKGLQAIEIIRMAHESSLNNSEIFLESK